MSRNKNPDKVESYFKNVSYYDELKESYNKNYDFYNYPLELRKQ